MPITLAAVIEPNAARWKTLCAALRRAGLKTTEARVPEALGRERLVVLGSSLPSPTRAARGVRERAPGALLLVAQSKGFRRPAWADGVLPLPVSPNDLRVRLAEREQFLEQASRAPPSRPGDGILDPSTTFYALGPLRDLLHVEVKRARRYGFPLAMAMVAFDPFDAGVDEAARAQLMGGLAMAIRRSLRDTDYPVQYSPDHVMLLMPHTDLAGALIVARRITERVARSTLQAGEVVLHPTISAGVASGEPGRDFSFGSLERAALEGMAAAVARGGNCVEFVSPAEPPVTGR